MNYEKYIKDGMVAVLYSPGFGGGWYTWNTEHLGLVFDKEIVEAILNNDTITAGDIATKKYPSCYLGGLRDLEVMWLKEGTEFEIEEYDGSESIHIIGERDYLVA